MRVFKRVIIPTHPHTHTIHPLFSWQPRLLPFALVHPQPINISQTWQYRHKFKQPWREASCMPPFHPLWNLYQLRARLLFLKSRSLSFSVFLFTVPVVFINKLSEHILHRNGIKLHPTPLFKPVVGFPPSPFTLSFLSHSSASPRIQEALILFSGPYLPTWANFPPLGVHTKGKSHFRWCFPDGKCDGKAHRAQQNGVLQILSLFPVT